MSVCTYILYVCLYVCLSSTSVIGTANVGKYLQYVSTGVSSLWRQLELRISEAWAAVDLAMSVELRMSET